MKRQRLERDLNVDFRTTCDTDMKIRKLDANKVLQEVKDSLAGGWNPRVIGTFI